MLPSAVGVWSNSVLLSSVGSLTTGHTLWLQVIAFASLQCIMAPNSLWHINKHAL